jgi:hypothetical protein
MDNSPVGNTTGKVNYYFASADRPQSNQVNENIRGLFVVTHWRMLAAVTDGTSNTMCVSEAIRPDAMDSLGSIGVLTPWYNPQTLLNTHYDKTTKKFKLTVTPSTFTARGSRWADGPFWYIAYTASMPPNSPSFTDKDTANNTNNFTAASTSSHHPGGIQIALLDGSARFISDSIDCGNLNTTAYPGQLTGVESPYGVWGSLATICCGETKTLD